MREKKGKRKRLKLKLKNILKVLLILIIVVLIILYLLSIRISHIEILGTNLITDKEIIEISKIKDYPKLFSVSNHTLENRVKQLELVNDVKVYKNLYGKVTFKIDEAKVLFYNKNNDKIVLSNEKEISNNLKYLGLPTLINYVPNSIYLKLINGLSGVDKDVLSIISEIEYSPSKTKNNEMMDEERFILRMNDNNTVYMNIVNIDKINNYLDVVSKIKSTYQESSGIIYLDSSVEGALSFKSYASIEREQKEKEKSDLSDKQD